jgi:hypothetical protein
MHASRSPSARPPVNDNDNEGSSMRTYQLASIALLCLLAGCARIEVYTDPQMKGEEVGFKFYTAKPYVLVARSAVDKPVEVSIKYLPDLANPLYAKPRPGWIGSSTLSMTFFESGILSTFNQVSDTNAAGMVTALAPLLTRAARDAPETAFFKLYEIRMEGKVTSLVEVAMPPL